MNKKLGHPTAQMTLINLIVIFTVLLMFAILSPLLQGQINTSAETLAADSNPQTDLIITLMQLAPAALVVAIIITALNQANPRVGSVQ
jgi:hypothetical protein